MYVKHGMWKRTEYKIWAGMKQRCSNPKDCRYFNYGARGITYCKEWERFDNFYRDMGDRPKGMSLDRINNDGNYCKENCRWATQTTQSRNTRLIHSSNTSGYRGVGWHKSHNRWRAYIKIDKKAIHIGYYETPLEAARAYDIEASKYEGFPLNLGVQYDLFNY